ncbi:uncharacterized protein LOC111708777 [Eurytemora carolleeae]|uniref:uncharacterized protein LOC111708777 n=1 Tax=Eurytemora carolleeae TaxID=1294199 RepID=UPI000C78C483|nr:uncharacterized protein LOC111708777 [Eurytemora carolleeae]|eukprot:XP_023338017.1 uncharacterized protein LOC111708777 [Eurytemora affinis]
MIIKNIFIFILSLTHLLHVGGARLKCGRRSLENGSGIKIGSMMVFSCNSGFKLHGSTLGKCVGGVLISDLPVCRETKPEKQSKHLNKSLHHGKGHVNRNKWKSNKEEKQIYLENSLELQAKNMIHTRVTQSHQGKMKDGEKMKKQNGGKKKRRLKKGDGKRKIKDLMLADQPPGLVREYKEGVVGQN